MEAGGGPPASTAPPVSAAADGATRQPSLVSQLRQMAEERTRNPGFIAQLESGRVAALPREHADHAALSGREEQRRPLASYASGSAVMCPNGVPRFVMYKYEEVRRCTPGFPPSYEIVERRVFLDDGPSPAKKAPQVGKESASARRAAAEESRQEVEDSHRAVPLALGGTGDVNAETAALAASPQASAEGAAGRPPARKQKMMLLGRSLAPAH